ncbi:MAG: hypothetical protein ACRD27_02055 [Terracidiphilus sp.]
MPQVQYTLREKKLITLACAIGILLCGACFLPPPRPKPFPPIPIRIDLQGIRSIRVEATNASGTPHLVPADIEYEVSDYINLATRKTVVSAPFRKGGDPGDALLKITVLSESAQLESQGPPAGFEQWSLGIGISATLTKQDGHVLWRESQPVYWLTHDFLAKESKGGWNDLAVRSWAVDGLSHELVNRMFYANQ